MFPSTQGRRPFSLNLYLTVIVVIAVLPVVIFSGFLINRLSDSTVKEAERNLVKMSEELANAFDEDVRSSIETLVALSQSENLLRGNLKAYHAVLKRVLKAQSKWRAILLIDLKGNRLISARHEYGVALGGVVDPVSFKSILETGLPTVGGIRGRTTGPVPDTELGYAIRVPVRNTEGKVIYILSAVTGLTPAQNIVDRFSAAPGEWVRAIVDPEGTLAGRSREPEKYAGKPASQTLRDLLEKKASGMHQTKTLDGVDAFTAIARAPFSGWFAAIAVPKEVLLAPAEAAQRQAVIFGLMMLALSGCATILLSNQVTRLIRAGSRSAFDLSKGLRPKVETSSIRELHELHSSLNSASELLQSRDKAKSEFLANMSHELRTPLGIVLGLTELLSKDAISPEERSRSWEIVQRNGQHLQRLIDDILDFSKLEANRLTFESLEFSIQQLIEAVIEDFSNLAVGKGISLKFESEAHSPQLVMSDPVRVRQILSNLVGNALKFTERGAILIKLYAMNSELIRITVADTGIGLTSEQQSQLFREFTQGDSSHTRKFGGTGLGLSLSRKLARLLGGDVRLIESLPGMGSVFEITLLSKNLFSDNTRVPAQNIRPVSTRLVSGAKILLAEDSPDNVTLIKLYLKDTGAEIDVASNGRQAVALAQAQKYDLILMDIQMPDVDGFEATRQIRRLGVSTPIIALTAHALDEHRKLAEESGFSEFLTKPLKKTLLVETVVGYLSIS